MILCRDIENYMKELKMNNYKNRIKYMSYLNDLYNFNKELFYKKTDEIKFYNTILFDCLSYKNVFNYLIENYKDKIDINI